MDRRKTVLVVDFDSELLIALERLLEDCGFDCTSTWDANQGYELMRSGMFDILVIGNRPPQLQPQEFVSILRRQGLRFGLFVLGNLDHQDGFSNLVDQLRRFPCEFLSNEKNTSDKARLELKADLVFSS